MRTACRCTNVPRRLSWPASRIGVPSMSSDPNASSSPIAQSIPPSRVIAARRSSSCRSLGCTVKPSGMFVNASPICWSVSAVMAVLFFHRGAAA